VLVKQIQLVASIIHEMNSLKRVKGQTKQCAFPRRGTGFVQQCRSDLVTFGRNLSDEAIVAIYG